MPSTDTFDGLVTTLQETLHRVGSDVRRLAEQHRVELERSGASPERQVVSKEDAGTLCPLGEFVVLAPTKTQRMSEPARIIMQVAPPLPQWPDPPGTLTEDYPEDAGFLGVLPTDTAAPPGMGKLSAVHPATPSGDPPSLEPDPVPGTQQASFVPFHGRAVTPSSCRLGHPDVTFIGSEPPREPTECSAGNEQAEHRRAMRTRIERMATSGILGAERERTSQVSAGSGVVGLSRVVSRASREHRACLPDVATMKDEVRKAIAKPEYNVASLYHSTGVWQFIARSPVFDTLTLLVIFLNTVWIAVEIDGNNAPVLLDAPPAFQVVEHLFCTFYVSEWVIRFLAFRRKRDSLRDGWFIFDSTLAILLVLDTWVITLAEAFARISRGKQGSNSSVAMGDASLLRLVRVARILRLTRLSKLLWACPELLVIIRGIGVAVRSVFFTLCLQFFVIYVFAVTFKQLTEDTELEKEPFPSVPAAFVSLLLRGILPDFAPFVSSLGSVHVFLGIVGLIFVMLASVTIMNFIVGVLVEVVKVVSAVEQEQLQVAHVRRHLVRLLDENGLDEDRNKRLSRREFEAILMHPRTATSMRDMGVDVVGLVDFIDVVFKYGQELPIPDFIQLVLQLRGTNSTTVKDIVDLRKFMVMELRDLEENLTRRITEILERGLDDPASERATAPA
eukprot:CAMPEP_0179081382 /NCGR_PEP_ID=MMETSP0796-20121207/36640_1 /TAXON_ID=73915 /ORGANISM="Pyrodinium bahamense, Strain pbaha01" /LENGTH=673 /DNA_ID=CAMNT_0020778769 /DNA_START=9 /DNA_END=2030 /DNA_ORIENTATION=+